MASADSGVEPQQAELREAQAAFEAAVAADVKAGDAGLLDPTMQPVRPNCSEGSYADAAKRALGPPAPRGASRPQTWQCRGRQGCGYRLNCFTSAGCAICFREWWKDEEMQIGSNSHSSTEFIKEVPPQQLAAKGRKGAARQEPASLVQARMSDAKKRKRCRRPYYASSSGSSGHVSDGEGQMVDITSSDDAMTEKSRTMQAIQRWHKGIAFGSYGRPCAPLQRLWEQRTQSRCSSNRPTGWPSFKGPALLCQVS